MNSENNDEKFTDPKISKISMLFSGILMGNVGLLVTLLSHYSVYSIVLLRGIFGTFFLTLFLWKKKSFSKSFIKSSIQNHWKALLLVGILNPIVILLYFSNIVLSSYAVAAFLLYTSGIWLLILLIISKLETVSKLNIISFIIAIIGVALIMEFWNGQGFSIGIILGLLSGVTLAFMTFFKKSIYKKRKLLKSSISKNGDFDMIMAWWSSLCIVIMFLPIGAPELMNISLFDIVIAIILGLFPTALAFTLYNIGVKNDKGGNIVILSYFEPVMATINSIIFRQSLSTFTIIGGVLILLANIIVLKYDK